MTRAKILGTGRGLPERVVTNDDLAEFLDTSDAWIRERTGICQRRIAAKETLLELCEEAARQAMDQSGVEAGELDMIIAATLTADHPLPNLSSSLQRVLGADNAVCFDLSAACSGFIFALTTAQMYIQSGHAKKVLVLGGEILSKIMDWTDRSTCILFGDGAGAAVVGVSENEEGILAADLGSNGKKGGVLSLRGVRWKILSVRRKKDRKNVMFIWKGRKSLNLPYPRFRPVSGNFLKKAEKVLTMWTALFSIRPIYGLYVLRQNG